ncbi:MAG: adenylyl-sulfate kinase, partial [Thermoanaerobaculia bacterium]|nr:adenylyl-sulfate kinase [Thermoanaerobaculia bacterium]
RLFARARSGELSNVTGIDSPYQAPVEPDLELPTGHEEAAASVERIWQLLVDRGLL